MMSVTGDTATATRMSASERREQLLDALGRLGEADRLVIACRYLLELSEAETAAALGCPKGTVKSRLSRALGRLRAELAARAGQEVAGAAGAGAADG